MFGDFYRSVFVLSVASLVVAICTKLDASHSLHTNFILEDGSLWGAGNNSKGQLGDGTTVNRSAPVQTVSAGVIAVSSGEYHTMFIKNDFTLWGLGQNDYGQLGDGSTTGRSTPVQVSSDVISVSCGYKHTIFLKRDGSLWGMGGNHIGQLGDASGIDQHSPIIIESSDVFYIAAGGYNSFYIKTNGSLWGTGYNEFGQIGNGTTTHVTTPHEIRSSGVQSVSAGSGHTAYLMTNGSVWTSGRNNYGQLGDGTNIFRQTFAQIFSSGIKSISLGWYTTFIVKENGSLWAAGLNWTNQLGDGTVTNRSTPVESISSSVSQVSTGIAHSTVLKDDGTVWAFGDNQDGRLGIGTTVNASSPTQITSLNGLHRLADVPHEYSSELNSTVSLKMIWVQPGTFTMGQTGVAEPEHNVTLTKGFYLGKYEVTQAQYEAVMKGNTETNSTGHVISATPSNWPNNPDRPVERVSWDDIQVFLSRLNEQQADNIPAGWAYVLPTEAQWEYACRTGTTTAYSWGDDINSSHANYAYNGVGTGLQQTTNVGSWSANPWGFFDMIGNVWEWTADAGGSYASGSQTDPFNAGETGSNRIIRGGSWGDTGAYMRSASRYGTVPINRGSGIGFRVGFQQVTEPPTDLRIAGQASSATMLKNIAYDGNSSDPSNFTEFNGEVYFSASDANGTELWKTDGTESGTVMVKDIYSGTDDWGFPYSSSPDNFTVFNGALYFSAEDGSSGRELWKTDGTESGELMV
jgi:ELWxxDGT repeat protein